MVRWTQVRSVRTLWFAGLRFAQFGPCGSLDLVKLRFAQFEPCGSLDPIKLRRNALHAWAVDEKFEAFSCECFCEDIRQLIIRLEKIELNNLILNLFLDEVVSNCNVFHP
ncbi:hypothetical protein Tco_0534511 [Tanacetum coccineum]